MKIKKNKFVIFYIFNIVLLLIIVLLTIPFSRFLSKINLEDNDFVTGQVVINPEPISGKIIDRFVNINFIAEVDSSLDWDFKTLEKKITIKVGESKIINYEGKNISNREITSTADFIVSPESILPYVIKTECFCFKEQTLRPGESKKFTMVFYLDTSLDSDKNFDNLEDLIFTYHFSEIKS